MNQGIESITYVWLAWLFVAGIVGPYELSEHTRHNGD